MSDQMPIALVTVGQRRREDYGDLEALAASIEKYDLLHPVVVDDADNLVAGERRLEACKLLGWTMVPVRRLGELTEAERREIELEENLRRKDLTQYERNKTITTLAETAREIAETCTESVQVSKPVRGPSREPGSARDVAERIGIPVQTIRDAERHVSTVEANPFMGGDDWKQYHVLEARNHLERLPEDDRPKAASLINQPATPPKTALEMLHNLATMPAPERSHVFELADSPDARDRSLALTTAAKRPAMPDPRLTRLRAAIDELRGAVTPFPNDPLTPRIVALIQEARSILAAIQEVSSNGR